ncbi:MAG: hypothetical protein JO369_01695 [Paucibacter sp.]|nr:hypothetical protein [Roseateles sp.]
MSTLNQRTRAALAAAVALALFADPAQAGSPSQASSELSVLPVAVSVAAPAAILSTGVALSVVAVEATAEGTVWVLERASDGARASVHFTGQVIGGVAISVGTVVTVTAVGSGCILSAAGRALAFVPNEIGKALLYDEKVTR